MTDEQKNMAPEHVISVQEASKSFRMPRPGRLGFMDRLNPFAKGRHYPFPALNNISLDVKKGEMLGVVGRNGSGKTTLLKIICGITTPTRGRALVKGNTSALLDLGAGFDPEFSGVENVYMNGALMGFSQAHMDEKLPFIAEFADIGEFMERPVKTYSSGMFVRLAFATAIHTDPDILVVDETLAVGDEAFKRKCFARINSILRNSGTIIFVSHSLNRIVELCDRAVWLDQGDMIMEGDPARVVFEYERFANASDSMKSRILDSIKENGPPGSAPAESFDDQMISKTVRSYESNGAEISRPRITTMDGEEVNNLVPGEKYIYTYDAAFSEDCEQVRFAMMFRTQSGFNIGGMVSHPKGEGVENVKKGGTISPGFVFRCKLIPDMYFVNSGVLGFKNGDETYLHRVVDGLMFRVSPQKGLRATGLVDFSPENESRTFFINSK